MRILKTKEENNSLPTMTVTCTGIGFSKEKGCGYLLEVNGLDIEVGYSTDMTGSTDSYYFVRCPNCGAKTEVFYSKENRGVFSIVK